MQPGISADKLISFIVYLYCYPPALTVLLQKQFVQPADSQQLTHHVSVNSPLISKLRTSGVSTQPILMLSASLRSQIWEGFVYEHFLMSTWCTLFISSNLSYPTYPNVTIDTLSYLKKVYSSTCDVQPTLNLSQNGPTTEVDCYDREGHSTHFDRHSRHFNIKQDGNISKLV